MSQGPDCKKRSGINRIKYLTEELKKKDIEIEKLKSGWIIQTGS